MKMNRRDFIASLSLAAAASAHAEDRLPADRKVKWALSSALWNSFPTTSINSILDVMQATGFIGVRLAGFPRMLDRYGLTAAALHREMEKRNLHIVTISWGGPLQDSTKRQQVLDSARDAIKFLADFGANHLVVFSPKRPTAPSTDSAEFRELCARCNQIGELAGGMGFTAGLHNHLGEMVQTQQEVDRFMTMTDARLFGLSPDTAHLHLSGCEVVGTLERYKQRIRFLDYKDAKWTTPAADLVQANGVVLPKDSESARFYSSIYDLGDGEIDFPACHRVLKSAGFEGWICVDLDTARLGPLSDFQRCGEYVVKVLEPIYR